MIGAVRQDDGEGAAAPDLAVDPDCAAVKLDQFLNQREADAAALNRASARAFDAAESLEQMRQFFGGDARASVANSDVRRRCDRDGRHSTTISPSNVNLNAFEIRLRMTFSHMSRLT